MQVQYDQVLTSPNLGRAGSDGINRSRLVLLRANDSFIGMLGLWQFLDGPVDPPPTQPTFHAGDIVLLFNATDLEARFSRAAEYLEQTLELRVTLVRQRKREVELHVGVAVGVRDREAVGHGLGAMHVEAARMPGFIGAVFHRPLLRWAARSP